MNRIEMADRTKKFALRVIHLVDALPSKQVSWTLGKQLLRSGTSIGANYREASKASSRKHFASIMAIASREADETLYWLELLGESGVIEPKLLVDLMQECNELVAIITASVKTAQSKE